MSETISNLVNYGWSLKDRKGIQTYSKQDAVAFGIFSKFDTKGTNSSDKPDTKLTKEEFGSIKKEDYEKYIEALKKEMKNEQNVDLSEVKIPSYEELEKKLDKGDLNLDDFAKSMETSTKKEDNENIIKDEKGRITQIKDKNGNTIKDISYDPRDGSEYSSTESEYDGQNRLTNAATFLKGEKLRKMTYEYNGDSEDYSKMSSYDNKDNLTYSDTRNYDDKGRLIESYSDFKGEKDKTNQKIVYQYEGDEKQYSSSITYNDDGNKVSTTTLDHATGEFITDVYDEPVQTTIYQGNDEGKRKAIASQNFGNLLKKLAEFQK